MSDQRGQTYKSGAAMVLEKLIEKGVTTVFGYPGGAVIPLYHEWEKYKQQLKHYRTSHEQHAVHAADGYARATGKVGVCLVTSGPGATNTVTGIATAFMDSIPMVIISGQVSSHLIGKDAFQEVDITSMTLAITKHNFLVRSAESLGEIMDKAFHIAQSGRPGPVLVDIPKDFLLKQLPQSAQRESADSKWADPRAEVMPQHSLIETLSQWINAAERPLIYCGGGVKHSGAEAVLLELAERLDCPVIHSLMGIGTINRRHRLSVGMAGMHGDRAANDAINSCDLLLAVGVRFSDRVIGNPKQFGIQAKIIHIDLDPTEHEKNLKVDLTLVGDVKTVLSELLPKVTEKRCTSWLNTIEENRLRHPLISRVDWIFNTINDLDDGNTIYATDVGQHQMWSAQKLLIPKSGHWLSSGGLGTMGFGLGAAVGAKVGQPDKHVMLITGDGSFRMNMQELSTLMDYKLKVDIVLFDNRALGMVRQWQALFQDQVYAETQISGGLDYMHLAAAFGMKAYAAKDAEALKLVLRDARAQSCSTLTVVAVSNDDHVFPIVPPGKGLEEALYS